MSCHSGKVGYATPQAARRVLEAQAKRGRKARQRHAMPYAAGELNVYRCPDCSEWHVGHRAKHATTKAGGH